MAVLHYEYTKFNKGIKLSDKRKKDLKGSRKEIRRKIRVWFKDNKPDELQPKFYGQGSFEMNTTVNPIPEIDQEDNKLVKYDLDYGVYFLERQGENNKKNIDTWHNWIYDSVENHTQTPPIRKTTCIRVVFSDGHHIDLPIYYMNGDIPELAHRSKDWIESDPKAFFEWFNAFAKVKPQLRRIVRYLKAWKDFREKKNKTLKLPSGFALTIMAVNNFEPSDNDDESFRKTVRKIRESLSQNFECLRPTTPEDENVFDDYSQKRKDDFLQCLDALILDCDNAMEEENFRKASEFMINSFGDRFPLGRDETSKQKNDRKKSLLGSAAIIPKPYAS